MAPSQTPYTLITVYSVESIFLGMNCVLYGFCAYTLWGQKSLSCRILLIIITVLFLLCAVQIILHTIFLFIVFTVLAGNVRVHPAHLTDFILTINIIHKITFAISGLLSIWRLYVLYDNNLRVCIPAFLLWIGQICASGLTLYHCKTAPLVAIQFSATNMLLWAFIAALNLYVTIPICIRLCMAQKRTHTTLSASLYKSIAIILVECGALITMCSVAMLILYARNFPYALASLGVATEIAVASQLLVTARHAMLSLNRNASNPPTAVEINVVPAEPRHVGVSDAPKATSPLFIRTGAKSTERDTGLAVV